MATRAFLAVLLSFSIVVSARAGGLADHVVMIVWDGFRPDCVSPELTPNLWQLRTNGVWFAEHHPVYPSITEANGPALITGAYPRRTDFIADSELRQEITNRTIGMENLRMVRIGDQLTDNHFLAMPTLPEMLHKRGYRTAIAGTKTVALLLDRFERQKVDPNGPVLYANATLPTNLWTELTNRFGPPPSAQVPNTRRDEWTTRCLIENFWKKGVPKFSLLWMSDVDSTQHSAAGVGSQRDFLAVQGLDRNLGLVLDELTRRKLRSKTDIILVSDHGFSTVMETVDAAVVLRRAGLNARRQFRERYFADDILVVGNAGTVLFYVIGQKPDVIQKTVTVLQHQYFTGTIFTGDVVPGTFPLSAARIDSPHAPDIVLALGWREGRYPNRLPGLIYGDGTTRGSGSGTHATLSPTDMHNTCVASGPDFRSGFTNTVATGNVDITPTLLYLFDITPTRPLDGRVLYEALSGTNSSPLPYQETLTLRANVKLPDGDWNQHLSYTEVEGVRYLNEGNGKFTATSNAPPVKATVTEDQ